MFCELTYESAWPIRLDNAFNAIAPILWMQAGCQGPIIRKIGKSYLTTDYYGVLFDYGQASKFCDKVKNTPTIKTVFVVTDDQRRYSNMCKRLPGIEVHRLYETFLRTFENLWRRRIGLMKYGLIDFQKEAVTELLKKMESMRRSYDADGSLSAVSLTAPTGAGKTVISAAVAEGLFYGNDTYAGDDRAAILWLSDSPSLNEQTMKRFDAATDLLNGAVSMEAISADFAKNHVKTVTGHIYF